MSNLEKTKAVFQCNGCGEVYESKEEAEQCFDRDSLEIPTFIEERIDQVGDIFPIEIILKRIEKGNIVEIGEYQRKRIQKVNLKVEENEQKGRSSK